MSSTLGSPTPSIEDALAEKQFKYIIVGLPALYFNFIIIVLFIAALVGPVSPPWALGAWVTTLVAFSAARGLYWRKTIANALKLPLVEKRAQLLQIEIMGTLVHFALESVLIFVVLAPDPVLRITAALAVWATAVGTALYLSVLPRMATIMVCAATTVFCAVLLYTGGRDTRILSLLLIAVTIALVLQFRRNFRTFKSAIEANLALDVLRADAMRLARTDALTGLPNRRAFEERRATRIAENRPFALAAMDLDGFKQVNDTHGHDIGDELLKQCASRLHSVDAELFAARIGGDEFVLMIEQVTEAEALVWKAAEALSAPYAIDGQTISVGVSSGLTYWLKPGDEDGLLKRADGALYRAKEAGPRAEGDGKRSLVVH